MAFTAITGHFDLVNQLNTQLANGTAVPAATTAVRGSVKQITFTAQAATFADLAAATAAYNALLTKLIAAGIMPAS